MSAAVKPRIGFLGLGVMGAPMATNLMKAGFPLTVWNRTAAKTEPFSAAGVRVGKGPAYVAVEADVIITMLAQPADVEAVVMGPDGVLDGIRPGSVVIDMSTVSPTTSRNLAGALTTKQAEFLDAPVIGSRGPATEGTLTIVVGGLPGTFERCRPILTVLGRKIIHAGTVGMGSTLKLGINLMLAHLMASFSEGLLLMERAGLDPARYLEALDSSAFRSPWYMTKGATVLKRAFEPHFALKHMTKDLRLMDELAHDVGTALPVTKAVEQVFASAEEAGLAGLDYSAVFSYLETQKPA